MIGPDLQRRGLSIQGGFMGGQQLDRPAARLGLNRDSDLYRSCAALAADQLARSSGTSSTQRRRCKLSIFDASFTVRRGTVVVILGPNGAGKTPTLRTLLGLLEPTSGTALFGSTRYRDLLQPGVSSVL